MSTVWQANTNSIKTFVENVLPRLTFKEPLVLKPNIVSSQPYPVTTDVNLVEAIIDYLNSINIFDITIAEGSSDNTMENFKKLGYTKLAKEKSIELIDLNDCDAIPMKNEKADVLKIFFFPKILTNKFIVSLANLKEHHAAEVTFTLKNMFGIAPGKYYSHNIRNKPWQKETLHDLGVKKCVVDIARYRLPDVGVIDGRIAQLGSEQYGPTKRMDVFLASDNCVALDIVAAKLLGHEKVEYLEKLTQLFNVKSFNVVDV